MSRSEEDLPRSQGSPPKPPKEELTGRTLKNFFWMFAGGSAEAVLKIVVVLILARLLLPEEFGVVSAALTVVALAEVMGRIGVAPSIIQVKTLTDDHVATGFTTTLASGILMTVAFFFLAGQIADLYRMPDLKIIVQVFSLLFVIKGAGLVSEALLQRKMRFPELAVIRLSSYLFGYAIVAIVLAMLDFGPWALVWAQLAQTLLSTVLYLRLAWDGIAIGFKWSTFVTMIRFGLGVTLTQIGNYVSQNADFFVVGRWLGAEALGYYSRSYLLLQQGAQLVGRMGDQVLFPTLATIQDDRSRLERALNRALALTAMTQIPLTALLVVAGPEIVLTLLGPQWERAVLPFQILISVLLFRTGYKFVGSILRAAGRVYIAALWQWSHALAVILGALIGQQFDLEGVAVGVSLAIAFCYFSGLFLVRHFINVSSRDSLRRLFGYIILGLAFAALLVASKMVLAPVGMGNLWMLVILFAEFFVVYLLLFTFAPKMFGREGEILKEQVLNRIRRRRAKN